MLWIAPLLLRLTTLQRAMRNLQMRVRRLMRAKGHGVLVDKENLLEKLCSFRKLVRG
jgi:hypothetical protein